MVDLPPRSRAPGPVSYTHLDVYKRQLSISVRGVSLKRLLSSGLMVAAIPPLHFLRRTILPAAVLAKDRAIANASQTSEFLVQHPPKPNTHSKFGENPVCRESF